MDYFRNLGFEERPGVLSRPEVHVNYHVFQFCEEYGLPIPMLYSLIQYRQMSNPWEAIQAMISLMRHVVENPSEVPLSRMNISELNNLLQFTVTCGQAIEENMELTFDDDDYEEFDYPSMSEEQVAEAARKLIEKQQAQNAGSKKVQN